MKIFFAGAIPGSNTQALLEYFEENTDRKVFKLYTFGNETFDVAFTNNGRLLERVDARLKVNTQHGNLFLGDTEPEPQYGIQLADRLFRHRDDSELRSIYLNDLGLDSDKRTVLYAPTYSRSTLGGGEKLFFANTQSVTEDVRMAEVLMEGCRAGGLNLIIRSHKYLKRELSHNGFAVPTYMMNVLRGAEIHDNLMFPDSVPPLLVSDLLITDFSSIAADFLALNRQIWFVNPRDGWRYTDRWHASKSDRHDMGEVIYSHVDLKISLELFADGKGRVPHDHVRKRYHPMFDGGCCERVFRAVMERLNG